MGVTCHRVTFRPQLPGYPGYYPDSPGPDVTGPRAPTPQPHRRRAAARLGADLHLEGGDRLGQKGQLSLTQSVGAGI